MLSPNPGFSRLRNSFTHIRLGYFFHKARVRRQAQAISFKPRYRKTAATQIWLRRQHVSPRTSDPPLLFPFELGFEYRSRGIRFNFIDGGPYQAEIRSIAVPEHMALKCDLRVRINLAIIFNPHIAAPLLSLIAKRATELKALIFLEKADSELNVHAQILVQLLLPYTVESEDFPCAAEPIPPTPLKNSTFNS